MIAEAIMTVNKIRKSKTPAQPLSQDNPLTGTGSAVTAICSTVEAGRLKMKATR